MFCPHCLTVHLGIDTEAASSSSFKGTPWHCPTCSSKCCCSQPECTKAHKHCNAHQARCRRPAKRKEQSVLQKLYNAQYYQTATKKAKMAGVAAGLTIPNLAQLKKLQVPVLRTLCGAHSVSSVGSKGTLVQRLDALRMSSAEAGAAGKTISAPRKLRGPNLTLEVMEQVCF